MTDKPHLALEPLWRRIQTCPRPFDPGRARWRLADFSAAKADGLKALLDASNVRDLLAGIADHSQYLWSLIEGDPPRCNRVLAQDPLGTLERLLADLRDGRDETETVLMRRLRRARQEATLLIALADLGGVWTLETVMAAQTRTADAFIGAALAFLLRRAQAEGELDVDPEHPERACGLVLLGVGKLGARELDYANEVESIAIFDPEPLAMQVDEAKALFVRIVRGLVRLLQHPTSDGDVMRVDLRLRPEPNARAVAISRQAALDYYETYGQNWERAALATVRVVAGDAQLGTRFIDELRPFVWRRYFDFAGLADVHAMTRQTRSVAGVATFAPAGYNISLGAGGLRDVATFTHVQQLVFGGSDAGLRGLGILPALRRLGMNSGISNQASEDLTQAYANLRRTLHRLQMFNGTQTDRLPMTSEGLERFARFSEIGSGEKLTGSLAHDIAAVLHHRGQLLADAPSLGHHAGRLVFTGTGDDPATLRTLELMGYRAPAIVASTVRRWHSGLRPAVRSARTRETLTELVPSLLSSLAHADDPDAAIAGFDALLGRLNAASELFAMLAADERIRKILGEMLGSAPLLRTALEDDPHLLEVLMSLDVNVGLDESQIKNRVESSLTEPTTEAFLDTVRDFYRAEHFRIDAMLLAGDLDPATAGAAYSALAAVIVDIVLRRAQADFADGHGRVEGAAVAVLAFGDLGAREMTTSSVLDLVVVYETEASRLASSGRKPLHISAYFARLTQRMVSGLTVKTSRGGMYGVDLRLRPSGHRGPLATTFSAFSAYHRTTAQTWELLALTRARVVAGDADLRARVEGAISAALDLASQRHANDDVRTIRFQIEGEKQPTSFGAQIAAGILACDLLTRYLALRGARGAASVRETRTAAILADASARRLIDADESRSLIAGQRLLSRLDQMLQLTSSESERVLSPGLQRRLARACGVSGFARLKRDVAAATQAIEHVLDRLLERT